MQREKFWSRMPNVAGMEARRDTKRESRPWRERIGGALRAAREEQRLTQSDLASLVGVDVATVSKTELGKTVPDFATLEAFADVLGRSLDDLTGRTMPQAGAGEGESLPPAAEQRIRALEGQIRALLSRAEAIDRADVQGARTSEQERRKARRSA